MTPLGERTYLIVNADDYGYFSCVSHGILEAARNGIVTATGIFATSLHLEEHLDWLEAYDGRLDLGVHLNLTYGAPVSLAMRRTCDRWGGRFPGKFTVVKGVLTGAIRREDVEEEWRAQIERCLEHGLTLRFLNSHEHIHMLPPLLQPVQALAKEYGISHVRYPNSEWFRFGSSGGIVRDMAMTALRIINRRQLPSSTSPKFLGLSESGRLSTKYLQARLASLKKGQVYELMCHPGRYDSDEVDDPHLLSYHDWEAELGVLTSPTTRALCQQYDIELIGYRDLVVVDRDVRVQLLEGQA